MESRFFSINKLAAFAVRDFHPLDNAHARSTKKFAQVYKLGQKS